MFKRIFQSLALLYDEICISLISELLLGWIGSCFELLSNISVTKVSSDVSAMKLSQQISLI